MIYNVYCYIFFQINILQFNYYCDMMNIILKGIFYNNMYVYKKNK